MRITFSLCLIGLFTCFWHISLYAQQGNVWAFGYHSGLDFNSNPPKPIKTSIYYPNDHSSTTGPAFASASISDCRGHLLFYGTNAEIFNRFNNLMPHGHLNLSDGSGIVYVVPFPNDTSKYYYFQQLNGNGFGGNLIGLVYSVVDMTLDSGRGDVIDTANEIELNESPNQFTIVKNSNDTDYWIICPVKEDTIYVYPLIASGIGHPLRQPKKVGFTAPFCIKGDHKGDKIIFAGTGIKSTNYGAVQFDFNNKYGLISRPLPFFDKTPFVNNNPNDSAVLLSAEYSENDSLLYLMAFEVNTNLQFQNSLYQCKTYNSPGGTLYKIKTVVTGVSSGLQLGPDNAIYWGFARDSFINKIQNPDNYGASCNLQMNAIDLRPGYLGIYLPNIYAPIRYLKFLTEDSICADSVHFANISDTVYFRSFKWYFGDGDSSAIRSPWHSYKKNGAYNVMLVGVNDCGAKLYYSDSIHVFKPAQVGFAVGPVTYSCLRATIKLHNTVNDTPDSIGTGSQTYMYVYGDTSSPTLDSVHTYTQSGIYIVTQSASNGHCQDTLRDTVNIIIEPMPKPGFDITNAAQCSPYKLEIKDTSQYTDKYLWLLDYSVKDTGSAPLSLSHSLSSLDTGYHSLSLIAYNNQGCMDTFSMQKAVYIAQPPAVAFTDSLVVLCDGIKTMFKNQSQFAYKYLWKFGDGASSAGSDTVANPEHIYNTSGTFQVSLTASNPYCSSTVNKDIKINIPTINASFNAENTTGCSGFKAVFVNSSYDASSFSWNFGDPSSVSNADTDANPTHIYSQPGTYPVSLVATSPQGCKDSLTLGNYINVLPFPKAGLSILDSNVLCGMLKYSFKNLSTNADTFTWEFGDGTSMKMNNDTEISHFYDNSGSYAITLKAGNGYCSDSANIKIKMTVRPASVPKFKTDDSIVCFGEAIHFINQSTNTDSISWNFGDGSAISDTQNPTYLYKKSGQYTATLSALSKQGCNTQYSQIITINPIPNTIAGIPQNVCSGTVIQLGAPPIAGQTYSWTSEPLGFTSNISNPIDSPNVTTTIYLKQMIGSTGCADSDSVRITVLPRPNVQFISKYIGGFEYQFTANSPNYPPYQYKWYFEDNSGRIMDTLSGYKLSYIFTQNGKYNVILKVGLPGYCTVIDSNQLDINEAFSLNIFPNPFDLQTNIQYTLINPAHIKISMTDEIGRQIGTLLDQQQKPGEYNLKYDGAVWKTRSAMYFIVFQLDDQVIVKKMIQMGSIFY